MAGRPKLALAPMGMTARASARDLEMCDLWLSGASFRAIAALPQIKLSHEGVRRAVNRAIAKLHDDSLERAQHSKTIALARIDRLLAGVWARATRGELPAVSSARQLLELRARIEGLLGSLVAMPSISPEGEMTFHIVQHESA